MGKELSIGLLQHFIAVCDSHLSIIEYGPWTRTTNIFQGMDNQYDFYSTYSGGKYLQHVRSDIFLSAFYDARVCIIPFI